MGELEALLGSTTDGLSPPGVLGEVVDSSRRESGPSVDHLS